MESSISMMGMKRTELESDDQYTCLYFLLLLLCLFVRLFVRE